MKQEEKKQQEEQVLDEENLEMYQEVLYVLKGGV